MRLLPFFLLIILLGGCVSVPQNVAPVDGFELNRYLGKWYEIARLDHSFERGLANITAEYSLREDGGVKVVNRGFSAVDNKWKEAEGKAYFVGSPQEGYLKVSFFGPFYGAYIVFELDKEDYQYAFITSYDKSYLWLLARTPVVSDEVLNRFIQKAGELGFATDKLIFPKQD
ncbi:MAG: lipocalin family protein [Proteobacteria bacterium]|nr:lipocalin family protein [Pseudomonadota bacterium]